MKDFTIKDEHHAIIRFNDYCVLNVTVNMESLQVLVEITDNQEEKRYIGALDLEEVTVKKSRKKVK